MSQATVIIGGDASKFESVIERSKKKLDEFADKVKQRANQTAQDMEHAVRQSNARAEAASSMASKGANQKRWATGNAAMQIQDIAVQAQMGVSATTILAQQGSQMASAFGPTGMIVGGVLAIGGAFVTMGIKANEAFANIKKDTADFANQFGKDISSGSLPQLISGLEKSAGKMEQLKKFATDTSGIMGAISSASGMMMGGESVSEKLVENAKAQSAAYWQQVKAFQQLQTLSADSVALAALKAEGSEREVDSLERQQKLKQDMAKIDAMEISDAAKDILKGDVKKVSAIEGDAANKQFDEKNRKIAQDFIESIEEDEDKARKRRADNDKKAIEEVAQFNKAQKDEFEKNEKERMDRAQKEADRIGRATMDANNEMVAAENALAAEQEKRLKLTDQIALAQKRVADALEEVKRQEGTGAASYLAKAGLSKAQGVLQGLMLARAQQFVGHSSADIRKAEREAAKRERNLEKAKVKAVDFDIQKEDARRRKQFGAGAGLTDAQKAAMRAEKMKGFGDDHKKNAEQTVAKAVQSMEADLKGIRATLDAA